MAREREIRVRRIKRRLKAAASVVIALAAGTFLACHKEEQNEKPRAAPNPTTPEDPNLPAPPRERAQDADTAAAVDSNAGQVSEDGEKGAGQGSGNGAAQDAGGASKGKVDKREHKKAMK